MKVRVLDVDGRVLFGTFVGLVGPDYQGDLPSAAVLVDGETIYLRLYHPSRVTLAAPEPQADLALWSNGQLTIRAAGEEDA